MSAVQIEPGKRIKVVPVIFRNGKALSEPLGGPPPAGSPGSEDLSGYILHGINVPSSWSGSTSLTFLAADKVVRDAGGAPTLQSVFDSAGNEITVTIAAGHYVVLTTAHRDALAGAGILQVRSGTAGGPSNVTSDQILQLILTVALL